MIIQKDAAPLKHENLNVSLNGLAPLLTFKYQTGQRQTLAYFSDKKSLSIFSIHPYGGDQFNKTSLLKFTDAHNKLECSRLFYPS